MICYDIINLFKNVRMKNYLIVVLIVVLNLKVVAQKKISTPVNATVTIPVIAFKANATFVGGEPIANATPHKVNFGGTIFNEGNCFSKDRDEFVAPEDGYYHFDLRVSWLKFSAAGNIELYILTNWHDVVPAGSIQLSSTTQSTFDSNFSALVKLKKADKVTVEIHQKSGVQQKYQQVQFSGFKVN